MATSTRSHVNALATVCLGVLLALAQPTYAQEPTAGQALQALRDAVERAEFERAVMEARSLLAREGLRAHERNDALELLAISQIAARDEAGARETLQELFTRDPSHVPHLRDPGPQVEAAFARAHAEPRTRAPVPVSTSAMRDSLGRTRIEVSLGEGRSAVETVDLFARAEEDSAAMHLVADVTNGEHVSLTLPTVDPASLSRTEPRLALYVEARAPSGYVLGRDGSREEPLKVRLEPAEERNARKRWWIWTSAAIVVAGVAVGAGIAAH